MIIDAFQFAKAGTVTLSVTDSSQKVTFSKSGQNIEFNNPSSTVTLFVEHSVADNNPTANTTTSYPVLPGHCKIIRMPDGATTLAYIGSAAGPTTMYVSQGDGV